MKSVSSVEKAVGLWHDLTERLGLAGMRIRKWCSNEPDVLRDIPVEDRADNIHLDNGNIPGIKNFRSVVEIKRRCIYIPVGCTHL